MPKDEFGREYLRRSDGGALIIGGWACGMASVVFALLALLTSSYYWLALSGALGSFWAILFITGYVTRAIYFVAGEEQKPRSRSARNGIRWRSEQGYRPSRI